MRRSHVIPQAGALVLQTGTLPVMAVSDRGRVLMWVGYRRDAATARQLLEDPDRLEELLESDAFDTDLAPAFDGLRDLYSAAADASEAVIHTIR